MADVDLPRLVATMDADFRSFDRKLSKLLNDSDRSFQRVERRGSQVGRNLDRTFSVATSNMSRSIEQFGTAAATKLKAAFAVVAAGVSLNELRKAADQYTGIINSLKVAGVGDSALSKTFDQLFASAQRNAVPLEALAQLYGRVSQAQTTLKASSQDIMQVTDIVAQSLRVSGKSASESSGALLQLAQAFSNGKVQAEEYNSLLDGAYPLLQAAAAGLKEAGGDVAKLTALVKDGKVSSEAFFRAIQAGAPLLEDKLAGAVMTTDQALQRLQNEFIKAVGEFDKATGSSAALASGLNTVADSMSGIGRAATSAVTGVQSLIAKIGELYEANGKVQRQQALGYQNERAERVAQAREMGLANSGGREKLAQERAAADAAATQRSREAVSSFRQSEIDFANRQVNAPLPPSRPVDTNSKIKPVSLADYKVPGDDKSKGAGSDSEKLSRYEREIQAIQRRTEALQNEAQMVGKGTAEVEKSKIALQLEQAAKRDGITITDEMRTAIDSAATGYANAKVKVEDLKKSLEDAQEAQKFFGDAITDSLGDLIIDGAKAEDVMKNLVKQIAKAALQAALMGSGPLAGVFGTSGSNGNAGGIFGMLFSGFGSGSGGSALAGGAQHLIPGFDGGGFTGPGGKNKPAGIVHAGEVVWSQDDVRRAGGVAVVEGMRRGIMGYAKGGALANLSDLSAVPAGGPCGGFMGIGEVLA